MKTTELRAFAEELLVARGATVVSSAPHLLRIRAEGELGERLGRSDLALAFSQRGLLDDPNSELATVGNPVFDRVLQLAQEEGRVGQRYLSRPTRGSSPPALRPGPGVTLGDPVPTYAPLYHHVFKVQSSAEETPDTLEVVVVDGVTLEVLPQSPDLVDLWGRLDPEPEPGYDVPPVLPVPEAVLRKALEGLERRLRRRLGRLKREAEEHLAKEVASIGAYYQNLIEESRGSRRRLAGGLQAREDKIRLLQLDWKRRTEEAQDFWQPKVEVELTGLGVVLRPTRGYTIRRDGVPRGQLHFDELGGGFLLPPGLEDGSVGR